MTHDAGTGTSMGFKLFVAFLILATTMLSVLTVLLSRENNSLRERVIKLQDRAANSGVVPGDIVQSLMLKDALGKPFALDFDDTQEPALILLTSQSCGSCEETIPIWEGVLMEVEPESLRVVCAQAGAHGEELQSTETALWNCYSAPSGHEGWLRRIPVAPAALLIDGDGRVLYRWLGHMSQQQAAEMRMALADVAGTS